MSFPLEIAYGGASIKFDAYNAKDFLLGLLGIIKKDKKYVCLLLDFTVKFLQDWYNDIIEHFTPIQNRGGYEELNDKEKDDLSKFMGQSKYVPIASLLAGNFAELELVYTRRPEKGGRVIIDNEQDFEIIKMFHEDISDFEIFGLTESDWRPNMPQNGLDLELLRGWEAKMQEAVNRHSVALHTILRSLDCSPDLLGRVIQKYKDGQGL